MKANGDKAKTLGDGNYLFSEGGTSGWNVLPWVWRFGGDIVDRTITKATGYLNSEKNSG